MRDIPEEMAARIESGAATLCHVWIVEQADGERLGFTDHDRDLSVDGVICRAASGWSQGASEAAVGLSAGSLAVGGVLDDERIVEAEVAAGLWDRATVAVWRVGWRRPDLRVVLGRGALGRIRREGEAFTAEIEGPLAHAAEQIQAWIGWSGGPTDGSATPFWATAGAASRPPGGHATSVGRRVSGPLATAPTSGAFRTFRAMTS